MKSLTRISIATLLFAWASTQGVATEPTAETRETLPALTDGVAPQNFHELWAGFDPQAEPLEVEVLKQWEEEGVVLKVLRYRIGIFKGKKAMMAAVYGYPIGGEKLPGLVQIHGGGQYADYKACLQNAKRGYATVSLAWAGRISAPGYRVSPSEVKLFWDGKTDDPNYKLTTDWGALDGYHAPGRNPGNVFPSARPAPWTLDEVESPRNSGWFLCALAARRALTFLEQQPEVDPDRLGVYGHSMGGKLTVMTAVDPRVKAAAPSCGGISDRHNSSPLFRATIGDDVSLKEISCPIVFLSPSNDFHGRIGDLPTAIAEIDTDQWRVTCSPHHNHQDTPPYEVATMLWMDQHLRDSFSFPRTPETVLSLKTDDGVPTFSVRPDRSTPVLSVDVFYTQHGGAPGQLEDREDAKHRFWHHAEATQSDGDWTAKLPLGNLEQPLWVYANVTYPLDEPVSGAGYYYRTYTTKTFNVSSLLQIASPKELAAAEARATRKPSLLIESFQRDWQKEWFTYKPDEWARSTHKIADETYAAPDGAAIAVDVLAQQPNTLVVLIDDYAAEIELDGGDRWQSVVLQPQDFRDLSGDPLRSWKSIRRLKLTPAEHLKPKRGSKEARKLVGKHWIGDAPRLRNLRWEARPNVVFILSDNQSYYEMSCHGHAQIKTPHIDALARQSVEFTHFYAEPFCSPSRTVLMTGRHAMRSGVFTTIGGRSIMHRKDTTLPDILKKNGYHTAIFGKWHLGFSYPYRPEDRGFDEVFVHGGGGVGQMEDYYGNSLFDTTFIHNGKVSPSKGYCTDTLFDRAIEYVAKHKNEPLFCFVSTPVTHSPHHGPKELVARLKAEGMTGNVELNAQVMNLDMNIGRMTKALDELGLANRTLYIYASDQGMSDRGAPHGGNRMSLAHDPAQHAPLFIRLPGARPFVCDRLTGIVDFFPTVLDYCGIEPPVGIDGMSLMPLLAGDAWPADRTLIIQCPRGRTATKWQNASVKTERWRFTNGKQLYDIKADPRQKKDIAAQHPEVVKELTAAYEKYWASMPNQEDTLSRHLLGAEECPEVVLNGMDWYKGASPWNSGAFRSTSNGAWAVSVVRDGRYAFECRIFPREADKPIGMTSATLTIGDIVKRVAVDATATHATIEVDLKAGDYDLGTLLQGGEGKPRGALFVYVKAL